MGTITANEAEFTNASNLKIFYRTWQAEKDGNECIAIILHGFAEHSYYYCNLAEQCALKGIVVYAPDHVGHGRSEGERVDILTFDQYIKDCIQLILIARNGCPEKPVFLIGHSMGGTIAIKVALEPGISVQGVVTIGPLILPSRDSAPWWKIMLCKLIAMVRPLQVVGRLNSNWKCHDVAMIEKCRTDELIYKGGAKARWCVQTLLAMDQITKRLADITWPFLIIHGDEDKICDIRGSFLMYEKAVSIDKCLKVVAKAYHQVHLEPDGIGKQCIEDIVFWLQQHCNFK